MATLIPDNAFNREDITYGEKKLLRTLANEIPDDEVLIFYQPQLSSGRRPDVIIYYPELGLILYEVKDWEINQIKNANPNEWEIEFNGKTQMKTAPLKQARQYFYLLHNKLEKEKAFLSKHPKYKGKVKIPIATAVAFPNILKTEFLSKKLNEVLPDKFVLFKDDIKEILNGNKKFYYIFKEHFDPWWENDALSKEETNILRGILFPEITAQQKSDGGKKETIILDRYQQNILERLLIAKGHSVIRGVAGSGKSLIIAGYAMRLAAQHPEWKILLTCYNISLASQLRYYIKSFDKSDLTDRQRQAVENIKIVHFHQLAKEILGSIRYVNEEQLKRTAAMRGKKEWEIEAEIDEQNSALLGGDLKNHLRTHKFDLYDAILVDEAQDFHPTWLESLLLMLNGKTNRLLLAEDPAQKIYSRKFTYKGVGINIVGKVRKLRKTYRSTKYIISLATKIITEKRNWDDFFRSYVEEDSDEFVNTLFKDEKGLLPELIIEDDYMKIVDYIVEDIKKGVNSGLAYSDFGILYLEREKEIELKLGEKEYKIIKRDYVSPMEALLTSNGIDSFWLSKNRESKQNYDQFQNTVTISTIFSAKGLEFHTVYLVGLELFPWEKKNKRENDSILYVAITRARKRLVMFSTQENEITKRIRKYLSEIQ